VTTHDFSWSGLLAGSAMACKYPGVLSVVIPMFDVVVASTIRQTRSEQATRFHWKAPAAFILGTRIAIGPWLIKNIVETGNPVYPLLHSVFGGHDWNAARNAQWKAAHSPANHDVTELPFWISDVSARNDWVSPLLYGLAPLAFLMTRRRRLAGWLVVGLSGVLVCDLVAAHASARSLFGAHPAGRRAAGRSGSNLDVGSTLEENRRRCLGRRVAVQPRFRFNIALWLQRLLNGSLSRPPHRRENRTGHRVP